MTAQSYSPWSFSWKQLYEDPRKNNWVKQGSNCFISFVVHHCHCHDEPSHSTSCIDNAAITQPCLLYTTGYNNMRTPYSNIWYIYITVLIHTHTTWSLKQQQKNHCIFPFLFTQGHFLFFMNIDTTVLQKARYGDYATIPYILPISKDLEYSNKVFIQSNQHSIRTVN